MRSRSQLAHILKARQTHARQLPLIAPRFLPISPIHAPASPSTFHPFSSSARSCNENEQKKQDSKQQQQQEQKQRKGPTPDEGSGPIQSPFKVFAQVLKEEISKNKAWQDNVKTLQGDVDKLADTQAMKRARDMYERARVSWSVVGSASVGRLEG